ncbi:UDP-N-acetylmuramoyl-L-alanyl-D-glutamate:meso-diaminopimelate ligase [uncultured Desulfatiglans sp.]|uniref:UDP-N-acetylmuramoyl-L-alanyl-D-glutamate--2,6-diaminopimelate ligase n=1 Tax=Uncultured Desulfatiglans sp. TaxID=1748965 RepID=A0A653AGU9_UNCDX|nr:UDP-N-acetylmuramoyl-L-alanyl-D-glutamate:meso-diaminopimelate ligase [uncultured Desulfatiglans sp.]
MNNPKTDEPRLARPSGTPLSALLAGLAESGPAVSLSGIQITGLAYDSRAVQPGYLFVAMRGLKADGHLFIQDAITRGAAAVVGEAPPPARVGAPFITVADSRSALATLSARFYGAPYRQLKLIGITGTNGKTTTSYLIESIIQAAGSTPGVMGTINHRCPGKEWKVPMTTPESLEIMRGLRTMADAGVTHVVMEVSSHALKQHRVEGCPFSVAVFTNLSRDHLDYHATMEDYFEAKSRLFSDLGQCGLLDGVTPAAVINMDDPAGRRLKALTSAAILTYGIEPGCDISASRVRFHRGGLTAICHTPAGDIAIRSTLVGTFNLHNIMAAVGAGLALGFPPEAIAAGIETLHGVPGRLEPVANTRSVTILVDYAHTPDALEKVLDALRPLTSGRLITVFGCGGDRDAGKRPQMGRVTAALSDVVVITSDNPRSEKPDEVIAQIEAGVLSAGCERIPETPGGEAKNTSLKGYLVVVDRRKAIARAVCLARPGDVVLIAGKGHEDYQIVGDQTLPFDDRKVAAEAALQEA